MAHAHIADQSLDALTPGRRRARFTLVAVDHDDPIIGPSERRRTRAKRVLTLRALDVLDDLLHRRLPNVQVRSTLEMMRLDLERLVHADLRSLVGIAMAAMI